jgi:hypothetical protein
MNYQKLYYFSFKNIKDELFIVEIWQDTTATITATEVVGDVDPCVLEYAALDSKLNPVHGSGVTLNMIATADHNFMDLYTGKIHEFLVKVYKESYLIWCGYLDPEMYSSPFSFNENYPVTFTCSDGFALLDRINYITPSDIELVELPIGHFVENGLKPYTGISSQWTVITNILTKLNLPVNYILVGISTVSNDFTPASSETIFHKTLVINDNYVNETLEPETCRTVLEGILKPYGAFIIQNNGSIYITDLNFLANNNNQTFKRFYGDDFTFVDGYSINLNIGDLSTIGFMSDQSTMNIVSAVNKIVVSYSNYKGVEVINSDMTDFTVPGAVGAVKGATNYQWTETPNDVCDSWTKFNNGRFVNLNGVTPQTDKDSYLSINQYSALNGHCTDSLNLAHKSFVFKKILPYFVPNSGYKLKIEISAFFRKDDNLGDNPTPNKLKQGVLQCNLQIGGMSAFSYRTSDVFQDRRGLARYVGWITTGSDISTSTIHIIGVKPVLYLFFNNLVGYSGGNYNYGYVEDTWLSLNDNTLDALNNVVTRDLLFPLDGFSGGLISLEIYDYMVIPGLTSDDKNALKASIKEVRIKDVKFTVVDKDGKDLNISDTEYFSALDPNYLNDTKIELIHGTNVKGCPIEKASLLYDDGTAYQFCTSWTRNGQTNILEKLLQNTVKSNYLNPTLELSCNVNNLSSLIGCVQYASQLGTNIFMVNSATIHLRDNITDLIIQTVSKDILNIV